MLETWICFLLFYFISSCGLYVASFNDVLSLLVQFISMYGWKGLLFMQIDE